MNEYVLIHIGKCAGTSVHRIFKKLDYKIIYKHVQRVNFNPNKKYIIVIRNPISRFISAFNWRFHNVFTTKLQKNRFGRETKILETYKTVNELAEDIYNSDGSLKIDLSKRKNYIHHIYEDINYYIGKFLESCDPKNIYGVIVTETMNSDLKLLFNIDREKILHEHELKNESYDKTLSDLGYSNLKKYLHKDYECIEKLYNMKLITKEQYDILSV